jgi:hypothetical protein
MSGSTSYKEVGGLPMFNEGVDAEGIFVLFNGSISKPEHGPDKQRSTQTYAANFSAADLPVSRAEETRLLANTSGATSL